MKHILYGAEISYYTGKVRAYLRWAGLPFTEWPAKAEVFREVIVPGVGVPVIPVLRTPDGELLQDSTEIIETLDARRLARGGAALAPPVLPATPLRRLVALMLETYGDEWLVIPAMHYRWHHNRDWAVQSFGALNDPDASPDIQRSLGEKRAAPFARAAELLGATAPMHAAVEASYEALLAELDAHFGAHAALLGPQATLADFGLIGPLYAHQYRDPASGALMRRLAPQLVRWVEQLQFQPEGLRAPLAAGDDIPATLLPVLRRMAREQLPVLVDTAWRVRDWMAAQPGQPLPRAIGSHAFTLEGRQGERIVRPYSLWMLQRVRDHLCALQGEDRRRADALLRDVGADALLDFPDPPRLARDKLSVRPAG